VLNLNTNLIYSRILIYALFDVGISRRWLKSKSGNEKSLKLFEEVDADLVSSLIILNKQTNKKKKKNTKKDKNNY
jgi:hypothetical protein